MQEKNTTSRLEFETIAKHSLKFGFFLGFTVIVLETLFYVFSTKNLVSFKFIGLELLTVCGFTIYSITRFKSIFTVDLNYPKTLINILITLLSFSILILIFTIILYHVIDTDVSKQLVEALKNNRREKFQGLVDANKLEEALTGMEQNLYNQFSVNGLIVSRVQTLMGYGAYAIIVSFFLRSQQPNNS